MRSSGEAEGAAQIRSYRRDRFGSLIKSGGGRIGDSGGAVLLRDLLGGRHGVR